MKTIAKLFMLSLMTLAFIIISCTKEGPEGPAGEQGISGQDGLDGMDGADGQNGTNGTDGNANIQSGTVILNNEDWEWLGIRYWFFTSEAAINKFTRSAELTIPEISQDIYDNGLVLVYLKVQQSYRPLPIIWDRGDYNTHIEFEYNNESLILHYFFDRTGNTFPPNLETYDIRSDIFKYIIIQGNPITGKSTVSKDIILQKMVKAGVDVNDYKQVADYFGLDY